MGDVQIIGIQKQLDDIQGGIKITVTARIDQNTLANTQINSDHLLARLLTNEILDYIQKMRGDI